MVNFIVLHKKLIKEKLKNNGEESLIQKILLIQLWNQLVMEVTKQLLILDQKYLKMLQFTILF